MNKQTEVKTKGKVNTASWVAELVTEFIIRAGIIFCAGLSIATLLFSEEGALTTSRAFSSCLILVFIVVGGILNVLSFRLLRKSVKHPYVTTRRVFRMLATLLATAFTLMVLWGFSHYDMTLNPAVSNNEAFSAKDFTETTIAFLSASVIVIINVFTNSVNEKAVK